MKSLVDSSALINFLRRKPTPGAAALTACLKRGERPFITPDIYREVLQGTKSESHFKAVRAQLSQMPITTAADVFNSHTNAAWMFASLRWKGITVRSTTDCLIAQIAIENDLMLIHDDVDFERIAAAEPRLKLA